MAAFDWNNLARHFDQAEGSAHDLFTQFMGGPSEAEVQLAGYKAETAQAKAAAAAAAATAKTTETIQASADMTRNLALLGAGVIVVVIVATLAARR